MPTTLQDLPVTKIKAHPSNPRGDVGDVAELAASIATKGILEPLIVIPDTRPRAAAGAHLLIAGHRRLAAAQQAKVKTVPCLVRDDLGDEAEQIEAMLVENLQRADLTPVEEARAYQHLLEFPGYTVKRITTATGRAAATVKQRVALAKLPAERLASIDAGQTTLAEAAVFVEFAGDEEATKDLARAQATGHASDWTFAVQRARTGRDRERLMAKLAKQHPDVRVVTAWPGAMRAKLGAEPTSEQIAEHSECGEQLVIWIDHQLTVNWVCVNPDHTAQADRDRTHNFDDGHDHGRPAPAGPAGETAPVGGRQAHRDAAEEAARAAREQMDADLAVAATVRLAFLCADVLAVPDAHDAVARRYVHQLVMDDDDVQDSRGYFNFGNEALFCQVLGIEKATDDVYRGAVAKLTTTQAVLLQLVLSYDDIEKDLERRGEIGWLNGDGVQKWNADPTRAWWAILDELGYQWTEVERRLIAGAEPAPEA